MKALSVIVASQNAEATIMDCLASLERQNTSGATEIIVVDNSSDRTPWIVEENFRGVRLIKSDDRLLIPELWARGAEQAAGEIIAFTTAHCIPDSEWLSQTLRHHELEYAAVGGAIENTRPASLIQWAVYFCRYAAYMLPFLPHAVEQVPGDNASYKRSVPEKYADLIKTGFWETVINHRLRNDGHSLLLTPAIRVYHGRSFGVRAFCRQRLVHGRMFGSERTAAASPLRRLLYIGFAPLIPLVFLGKIGRQVLHKGRHGREFLLSLPLVILFVLCWSLGEFLGYLLGAPRTVSDPQNLPEAEPLVHR
jgi:glycosyltransferase involved in cell wall biosynthesis